MHAGSTARNKQNIHTSRQAGGEKTHNQNNLTKQTQPNPKQQLSRLAIRYDMPRILLTPCSPNRPQLGSLKTYISCGISQTCGLMHCQWLAEGGVRKGCRSSKSTCSSCDQKRLVLQPLFRCLLTGKMLSKPSLADCWKLYRFFD